jgi:hypothetical protein
MGIRDDEKAARSVAHARRFTSGVDQKRDAAVFVEGERPEAGDWPCTASGGFSTAVMLGTAPCSKAVKRSLRRLKSFP